jgi:hypothetical protein
MPRVIGSFLINVERLQCAGIGRRSHFISQCSTHPVVAYAVRSAITRRYSLRFEMAAVAGSAESYADLLPAKPLVNRGQLEWPSSAQTKGGDMTESQNRARLIKAAWEQYKKNFSTMQAVILIATIAIYMYLGHEMPRAAVFFSMMELGAILGAIWGVRLKRKVNREIY